MSAAAWRRVGFTVGGIVFSLAWADAAGLAAHAAHTIWAGCVVLGVQALVLLRMARQYLRGGR